MSITILHLSDVHLGEDWIPRAAWSLRPWWKKVDKNITAGLVASIRDANPSYIVLSGDIVNKSSRATFAEAAQYLRTLLSEAGFDFRSRLLVVAGNHDVSFFPKKHPEDAKRLKNFSNFLSELYGDSDLEQRTFHFVRHDPDLRLIFACLDSTLRNAPPGAEGEVGEAQLRWLKFEVGKLQRQLGDRYHTYVKIAVLHHHCVPVIGTSAQSERFMQLLDAGQLLELLDELKFQVVLHGHKHVPHQQLRYRSDSSVLSVIGAGTATCVFAQDQQGFGNNFNRIEIDPSAGLLSVSLATADGTGRFRASNAKNFPLYRVPHLGYIVESLSSASTLDGTGKLTERMVKSNFRVMEPAKRIKSLPFQIMASATTAKIRDLTPDTSDAELELEPIQDHLCKGIWKLKEALSHQSQPIKIAYSYSIVDGTAMSKSAYQSMYASGPPEEETSVIITDPVNVLRMEVNFPTIPKRFPARAKVRVVHLGAEVMLDPSQFTFEHDPDLNRWTLRMPHPPLDHEISIVWELPETWPPA
ncbi:MAG TPA: metallophosphoesterase [Bryobacteraceae bacterium]|nr:metallophosphoesterase [Bryobacteraceae bacterium]